SDTCAAERLARVFAIRLVRVENCERVRKLSGFGKVMVRDDQVEPDVPGGFGCGKCADARINADHEPHTICRSAFDHVIFHTIPIANAMRHVEVGTPAEDLDGALQNDDGGGAVDVVVAIYKDALSRADRLLNA